MDDAEAADRLARLAWAPPPGAVPSFRLWHFPDRGPWATWILFVRAGTGGLLREVVRDRGDAFSSREAELSDEDVRAFRAAAAYLDLDPDDVEEAPALSEFGIEGFSGAPAVLRWGRPVPRGLRAIAAWHSRTRARFRERLDRG